MYQRCVEFKPLLRLILILFDKLCSMSTCVSITVRTFIRKRVLILLRIMAKRVLLIADLKIMNKILYLDLMEVVDDLVFAFASIPFSSAI